MSCQDYEDLIGDAVDGTLDDGGRAALAAHLERCAACRALADDLTKIRAAASTLLRPTPSPDMWTAIAAAIAPPRASHWTSWRPLAAAAALAIVLGAAAWFGWPRPGPPAADESAALVRTAASELQLAEQHYQNAIASLEQLTARKDEALDPGLAAEITASLASIDRAIADSRAALDADPDSLIARTSLLEALRMKVAVLHETVSLMNARS